MILKINYADLKERGSYAYVKGKKNPLYLRICIDDSNAAEAVAKFSCNPYVTAFDYKGKNIQQFKDIDTRNKVVIGYLKGLDVVKDRAKIVSVLESVPECVRVVMKLPEGFKDMQTLQELSTSYPNIAFCGGKLIRIQGVRIGCTQPEDLAAFHFSTDLKKDKPEFQSCVIDNECGCIKPCVVYNPADTNITFEGLLVHIQGVKTSDNHVVVQVENEKSIGNGTEKESIGGNQPTVADTDTKVEAETKAETKSDNKAKPKSKSKAKSKKPSFASVISVGDDAEDF